jgi:hypothetical protein
VVPFGCYCKCVPIETTLQDHRSRRPIILVKHGISRQRTPSVIELIYLFFSMCYKREISRRESTSYTHDVTISPEKQCVHTVGIAKITL